MKMTYWLWLLWFALIVAMFLRREVVNYMVIALIIIPLLIVLLELQEEIGQIREESKHQRKFVLERYNILSERITELSNNVEKKIVVDFSEFAKENPPPPDEQQKRLKKRKKKKVELSPSIDLAQTPVEEHPQESEPTDNEPPEETT